MINAEERDLDLITRWNSGNEDEMDYVRVALGYADEERRIKLKNLCITLGCTMVSKQTTLVFNEDYDNMSLAQITQITEDIGILCGSKELIVKQTKENNFCVTTKDFHWVPPLYLLPNISKVIPEKKEEEEVLQFFNKTRQEEKAEYAKSFQFPTMNKKEEFFQFLHKLREDEESDNKKIKK